VAEKRTFGVLSVRLSHGEDFTLHAVDVVNPGSGDAARIELAPEEEEQGPGGDRH
jgi:hypothetical protein